MTRIFHFIVLWTIVAAPAYGDTIGRLADGASCRDEKGAVRQPPVRPAPRAEVVRAPQGMVKTVRDIAGAACFFYLREVALAESPPDCDPAETAGKKKNVTGTIAEMAGPSKNISGTLGQQSCSDR
jgi:hypothetical protein